MEHVNISENTVWAWEKCSMEHVNISENTVWAWESAYTHKRCPTRMKTMYIATLVKQSHMHTHACISGVVTRHHSIDLHIIWVILLVADTDHKNNGRYIYIRTYYIASYCDY